MAERIDREALEQEKLDMQGLVSELEENYRKAEISESNYDELSRKYADRLAEIDRALGVAPAQPRPEKKEQPKEEKEDSEANAGEEAKEPTEEKGGKEPAKPEKKEEKKEEKKGGLFSRLIGKKGEDGEKKDADKKDDKKSDEPPEVDLGGLDPSSPEAIEKLAAAAAANAGVDTTASKEEEAPAEESGAPKDIEIEKLKLMLDTVREGQKNTDESIRNLAESIGEIRSMVFTEDSSLKEEGAKMEKIETEIGEVKPKEIDARFREFRTKMEQTDLGIEKLETKSADLAEKVNRVYDMMKKIGGVENLITVDKGIQQKIDDIKEALKYTERLALKTEKMFIDVNREIQDIVVYKTRQEGLDESVKDLIKGMDGINARLNDVMTKKDLDTVRQDILLLHNHLEEIQKILPLLEAKMPETIAALREERGNIQLFLESLSDHYKSRTITSVEYEEAKRKNVAKLAKIEDQLREEWKKLEATIAGGALPKDQPAQEGGEGSETQAPAPSLEKPAPAPAAEAPKAQETEKTEEKPAESEGEPAEEKPKKKRVRKKKEPAPGAETATQPSPEAGEPSVKPAEPPAAAKPAESTQPAQAKAEEQRPVEPPQPPAPQEKVEEKPVPVVQKEAPAPSPAAALPAPSQPETETHPAPAPKAEPVMEESAEQREAESFVGSAVARLAAKPPSQSAAKSEPVGDASAQPPSGKGDMEDVIKKVREKMG